MAATRELGLAALQRGDFDAAISYLERIQAKSPADFQALLCLAGAYHQTKRDDDAVRVLSQVVQFQTDNARAYYNLGVSLERLHRYEEAREALRHALTLKPDYALAAGVLAKWEQADAAFRERPAATPSSVEAESPAPMLVEPSIPEPSVSEPSVSEPSITEPDILESPTPELSIPESSISAPFIPDPSVPSPGIGESDAGSPSPVADTAIPASAPGEAVVDAPAPRTRKTRKARKADMPEAEVSVGFGSMPADIPAAPLEADQNDASSLASLASLAGTARNDASPLASPPCDNAARLHLTTPCDSLALPGNFAFPDDFAPLPSEGVGHESAPSETGLPDAEPTRRWRIFRRKSQPVDQEAPQDLVPLETLRDSAPNAKDLWRVLCPEARQALWLAVGSLLIVGFGLFFGPMAISRAICARSRIAEEPDVNGGNVAIAAIVMAAVGIILSVLEWSCLFIWVLYS